VHCDYNEIPGVWEIHIGRLQPESGFDGTNFDPRCGMQTPGDADGWQSLTPGATEENKDMDK
jgi:hypothetical protein